MADLKAKDIEAGIFLPKVDEKKNISNDQFIVQPGYDTSEQAENKVKVNKTLKLFLAFVTTLNALYLLVIITGCIKYNTFHIPYDDPYYGFTALFTFEMVFRTPALFIWFEKRHLYFKLFVDRLASFLGGVEYYFAFVYPKDYNTCRYVTILFLFWNGIHNFAAMIVEVTLFINIYHASKETDDSFAYALS
ncbi:5487_t:CDS:2 [Paraglomus occultum]|uniref:5487_t:CDS:1 n=1 Tax=Paraglomus occultum TaxID=144539 RepID=A0A9N8Z9I9_9GLOM|nr:5487_t:CDS:2 [Paraglomus occultum]